MVGVAQGHAKVSRGKMPVIEKLLAHLAALWRPCQEQKLEKASKGHICVILQLVHACA